MLYFLDAEDDQALCLTNCPIVHHSILGDSQAVPHTPDYGVHFPPKCALIFFFSLVLTFILDQGFLIHVISRFSYLLYLVLLNTVFLFSSHSMLIDISVSNALLDFSIVCRLLRFFGCTFASIFRFYIASVFLFCADNRWCVTARGCDKIENGANRGVEGSENARFEVP